MFRLAVGALVALSAIVWAIWDSGWGAAGLFAALPSWAGKVLGVIAIMVGSFAMVWAVDINTVRKVFHPLMLPVIWALVNTPVMMGLYIFLVQGSKGAAVFRGWYWGALFFLFIIGAGIAVQMWQKALAN
ncbi:MAG: hypothetical protein WC243_03725 [Patescibacteria group bacterium]|jgi:hypothetical protein